MAGPLRLEAREFRDLTRWRWVLLDPGSGFIADHEVRLDASAAEYEAFGDLRGYLRWHGAPDRRAEDEARILGEVGTWIGSQVLGPAVCKALARRRPVTVRVIVPAEAADLLYRPLELAHADGKPLAVQDVTLVMESAADAAAAVGPVGERLRVLGLFSLPEGGRSLNLRRERAELVRLVRAIAATGKAVDVRVLQYGVTRDRLRDVLGEAEGWDIIHVSGHGRPGSLVLETASGQPDRVTGAELAGLLGPARERLKLVTVSACSSAAVIADQQRRLLGLPAAGQDPQDDPAERDNGDSSPAASAGALAGELAGQLGCAVLAMRYPVGDDFAIALSGKLYSLLAGEGQPLPRAVGMTLRELSTATAGGGAFPALSMATPALFGGIAAGLRLAAPSRSGPASYDTAAPKMAAFPPEPPRFVGRTGLLARSSAALAPRSGIPGMLLQGMPGGGKTACALELAYGHEGAFDHLVWHKAPDLDSAAEGTAIDRALTDFALTLERYLDGFQMADSLVSAERLAAFLPRLAELMEQRRLLIVIDNLESLLSTGGAWRDDRWALVVSALIGHTGPGRVILTSRRLPARPWPGIVVESVDALSADEALLLARELPNLSALKVGAVPGIGQGVSRTLARNAIAMAQGHPKLLELAEGQAADPGHLLALVKAGDQAWRRLGGVPDGFFASGESTATGEDYLAVLAAWTEAVTDTLTPGERDLFWFLCCLDAADRLRLVLEFTWADLWSELGRDGAPPSLDTALAAITGSGLAAVHAGVSHLEDDYTVHPGIAAAARDRAGARFRAAVNREGAAFWQAMLDVAAGEAGDGTIRTGVLVHAALAGIPYMIRLEEWSGAAAMIDEATIWSPTPATAAAVLPSIQAVADHEPLTAALLARTLRIIDPAEAEARMRAFLADATTRGEYHAASVAAGQLANQCLDGGRLPEALSFADEAVSLSRRAGNLPWSQLSDEIQRLSVLIEMGQASHVIDEVGRLGKYMRQLPDPPEEALATPPQRIRELLFATASDASRTLGRWRAALDFNAKVIASMRDRGAPIVVLANAMFNDYLPLLRLHRRAKALALLQDCRQVFADAHDTRRLALALSALADIEHERGHTDEALRFERDALRLEFLSNSVAAIAVSYQNLGIYYARQPAESLACSLASAVIRALTTRAAADDAVRNMAVQLRAFGAGLAIPADLADLDRRVGEIPGTDLPGLIARLSPDPEAAEHALRDLVAQAQEFAAAPPTTTSPAKRRWRKM